MSSRRQLIGDLILVLLLFFVASGTICTDLAADETKESSIIELGVMSGWAFGDLKKQDDYEMVPLYAQIGFDAKPLFNKIHINPPGSITFYFEPFLNTILSPDSNVEIGLDHILRYRHPLTQKFHVFIEGGLGMQWSSQHTTEQSTQFNFNQQVGAGFTFFFSEDKSFNVGYRYRHFSNASIKDPNDGVDLEFVLAGFSIHY